MDLDRGSFSGYVRHRKALDLPGADKGDVSRKCAMDDTLRDLVLAGKYDDADARWLACNRQSMPRAPRCAPAPAPALTVDDAELHAARADPAPSDVDYQEARRRREYWTSEGERLKVLEKRKELTPADDARKTCRAFGLRVRQAFESAVETRHQSLHAESGMELSAARSWLSDFVREVLAEVADAEPVE